MLPVSLGVSSLPPEALMGNLDRQGTSIRSYTNKTYIINAYICIIYLKCLRVHKLHKNIHTVANELSIISSFSNLIRLINMDDLSYIGFFKAHGCVTNSQL
jgi:hypothetical protein